jgi:hypothetical protein
MNDDELIRATDEEVAIYRLLAGKFIKSTNFYQSARSTATWAVADYMAFVDGKYITRDPT